MMRLALWQGCSPGGDISAGFEEINRALATAKAAGADLLLMPELFLPGYNQNPMLAEPDWTERLSAAAAEHDTGLVIGVAEEEAGEMLNLALAFGPDGALLARYVKKQLYGEREQRIFRSGDCLAGFSFGGLKIGLLVCYDIEFPENTRAHARDGVDLILVPTANPEPFDTVSRFVVPAQAMQNGVTIAYSNFCGEEGDIRYCGRSLIAGPDGEPLAMAGKHPALLIADIPARGDAALRPLSTQLQDLKQ